MAGLFVHINWEFHHPNWTFICVKMVKTIKQSWYTREVTVVYHQELAGRGPRWGRCQDLRKGLGNPGWKLGSRWRGPRDSHVQIELIKLYLVYLLL